MLAYSAAIRRDCSLCALIRSLISQMHVPQHGFSPPEHALYIAEVFFKTLLSFNAPSKSLSVKGLHKHTYILCHFHKFANANYSL